MYELILAILFCSFQDQFLNWLKLVKEAVTILAAIVGVYVAIAGLGTWKKQIKTNELQEMDNNVNDRLVDVENMLELNSKPNNYDKIIMGLRYNSTRFIKHDKTIFQDVTGLVKLLSSTTFKEEEKAQITELIGRVRDKMLKLWL
jgi:hypothetical protein